MSLHIWLKVTSLAKKDYETKLIILVNRAGRKAQNKFKTFKLNEEQNLKKLLRIKMKRLIGINSSLEKFSTTS